MSESKDKYYVLEWDKNSNGEHDLKVTPHDDSNAALDQAKNSTSEQRCVSTENPLKGKESDSE